MTIQRLVGRDLKRYREAAGLSQEALAFECGLHRTYVSGVERGVRNPTVVVLERLAQPLEIEPWRLLLVQETSD